MGAADVRPKSRKRFTRSAGITSKPPRPAKCASARCKKRRFSKEIPWCIKHCREIKRLLVKLYGENQ